MICLLTGGHWVYWSTRCWLDSRRLKQTARTTFLRQFSMTMSCIPCGSAKKQWLFWKGFVIYITVSFVTTIHQCRFIYSQMHLAQGPRLEHPRRWSIHLSLLCLNHTHRHTHTHTHTRLMALCPGLPGWASTKKEKPIWILLKQETVSGSVISWAICKSAPRSRQIPHQHSTAQFFTGRMPFLPPNQQRQSTEGNCVYIVSK